MHMCTILRPYHKVSKWQWYIICYKLFASGYFFYLCLLAFVHGKLQTLRYSVQLVTTGPMSKPSCPTASCLQHAGEPSLKHEFLQQVGHTPEKQCLPLAHLQLHQKPVCICSTALRLLPEVAAGKKSVALMTSSVKPPQTPPPPLHRVFHIWIIIWVKVLQLSRT